MYVCISIVMWDVDVLDWTSNGLAAQQKIYEKALASGDGHIALEHDVITVFYYC